LVNSKTPRGIEFVKEVKLLAIVVENIAYHMVSGMVFWSDRALDNFLNPFSNHTQGYRWFGDYRFRLKDATHPMHMLAQIKLLETAFIIV